MGIDVGRQIAIKIFYVSSGRCPSKARLFLIKPRSLSRTPGNTLQLILIALHGVVFPALKHRGEIKFLVANEEWYYDRNGNVPEESIVTAEERPPTLSIFGLASHEFLANSICRPRRKSKCHNRVESYVDVGSNDTVNTASQGAISGQKENCIFTSFLL